MLPAAAKMWTDSIQKCGLTQYKKRRELNLFPALVCIQTSGTERLVCIQTSGTGRLVCFYPRINNGYKHITTRLLSNEEEEKEEKEKKKEKKEKEKKRRKRRRGRRERGIIIIIIIIIIRRLMILLSAFPLKRRNYQMTFVLSF
jgi:hypothetical protein